MKLPWQKPVEHPWLAEDEVFVRIETKDRWGNRAASEEIWKVGEKMTVEVKRPA